MFCSLPRTIRKLFQGSAERCPAFVGSGHQEARSGSGLDICGCFLSPTLGWLTPSLRRKVSANAFQAHFLAPKAGGRGQGTGRHGERGQLIYLVSTLSCDNTKHPLGPAKETCFSGDGRKRGAQLPDLRGGSPCSGGE